MDKNQVIQSNQKPNDEISVLTVLHREYNRFKAKGRLGFTVSLVLLTIYLYIVPIFGRQSWPLLMEYKNNYKLEDWKFAFALSWMMNVLVLFIANFVFLLIYKLDHPFFEKYKIYPEPWLWKSDPERWNEIIRKTMKVILFNNFIIVPSMLCIQALINKFTVKHSFDINDLPDTYTIITQLLFCIFIEDIGFTTTHRILHIPFFYKYIHKLHHEYIQSVGICAEYTHPLEFAFGNMLPVGIPCMILGRRMHFFTFIVWGTYRIINTTIGHSGYEFPFLPHDMIPMKATSAYHDYHHSNNVGNYSGLLTFWDTIFSNNKSYYKHLEKLKKTKQQ